MNSPDPINDLLRNAKVPERPTAYWQDFPKRVIYQIQKQERQFEHSSHAVTWNLKPLSRHCGDKTWNLGAWLGTVATACLLIGFFVGSWYGRGQPAPSSTMAQYGKVYREMTRMFPNQVQAIVMDASGMHLVLAEKANVPASQPLLVKVATGGQTQRIITFSGQQVRLNGESCEVMTDAEGNVILVGKGWCWSSRETRKEAGHYEFEAQPLEMML